MRCSSAPDLSTAGLKANTATGRRKRAGRVPAALAVHNMPCPFCLPNESAGLAGLAELASQAVSSARQLPGTQIPKGHSSPGGS